MKSIKFFAAALVFAVAVPMFAQSTATGNLDVRARVSAVCTITTTAVDFAAYDPTAATADTATGGINVTCTRGANGMTIDLSVGANAANAVGTTRAMSNGASEYLSYDLFSDSNHSALWTTGVSIPASTNSAVAQAIPVYGRMPALQDAAVGTYGDTVLATLNY